MRTYLLDIADRFRRFDEQLDVKALLCNKSWQVFNDSGVKEIYIFQEDGSLIISLNGKVNRATWQYIPANRSLIINSDNESYMLRPFFQDENLFTLQLDGTREYSFLLNEAQRASFPVESLSDLKFYLEHKEERLLQIQVEKERQLALQQREEELRKKKRGERKERLQAFILEKSTFSDSDGKGKWAFKGEVTYVSDFAFGGSTKNTTLKSITLPESINDIGYSAYGQGGSAFENCTALESIEIKGNIKTIRVSTFNGCSSLKNITLPESLTTIEYNAFQRCTSLEEIVIPDAVTTIEKQVFSHCTSLTTATIGSKVESIGVSCFNECKKLVTVICKAETPPTLEFDKRGNGPFMKDDNWNSIKYIKNIYVPTNAVEAYKAADGWKDFSDRISAITE